MPDPQSSQEWLLLCDQKIAAAVALQKAGQGQEAWNLAGHAVEAALKAVVMHRERLNRWPDVNDRRELYTHNFENLARLADIHFTPDDPVAPSWAVVLPWTRGASYELDRLTQKVIDQNMEAVCGSNGVVTWLKNYLQNS